RIMSPNFSMGLDIYFEWTRGGAKPSVSSPLGPWQAAQICLNNLDPVVLLSSFKVWTTNMLFGLSSDFLCKISFSPAISPFSLFSRSCSHYARNVSSDPSIPLKNASVKLCPHPYLL